MNLPLVTQPPDGDESGSRISLPSVRPGQLVNGVYRLQECIGRGGMGEVYRAEHVALGREVAVKILRSNRGPRAAQRFRREAQAIARVENEYVVNVFDCGELDEETPYLVMELLRGQDLRRLLDAAAPLPIPRAVNLIWEACQGIAAVHDAGIIHRDLKPENLFVSKRATGEDWCKVLDFGVAKQEISSSTAEGALVGTVCYMAPEQLQHGAVSAQSDTYSLGAILYECLSGHSPHLGGTVHELMFKIMNDAPLAIHRQRAQVQPALSQIVMRCLDKDPRRRFASARALATALKPFTRPAAEPVATQVDTLSLEAPAANRGSGFRSLFFGAGLAGLAGLVGGIALAAPIVARFTTKASNASAVTVTSAVPSLSVEAARDSSPPGQPSSNGAQAAASPIAGSPPLGLLATPSASTLPVSAAASKPKGVPLSAPASPRASEAAVVLAPPARFDSSNPYTHP